MLKMEFLVWATIVVLFHSSQIACAIQCTNKNRNCLETQQFMHINIHTFALNMTRKKEKNIISTHTYQFTYQFSNSKLFHQQHKKYAKNIGLNK